MAAFDEESLQRMLEFQRANTELLRQRVDDFARQRVSIKKQLLVYPPSTLSSQPDSATSPSAARQLIITRHQDTELRIYRVPRDVKQPLQLVSTYCIKSDGLIRDHTVAPDRQRAACTSTDAVLCFDSDGDLVWRYDLGSPSSQSPGRHYPNCTYSPDGTRLWVYRPDVMARRRRHDSLVVLNADNGEVVAEATLNTVGEGAQLLQHPDGRQILLDVGEGQDGSKIFRAAITAGGINLHCYGWNDRCLVDIATDGQSFLTIAHSNRNNASFHRFPQGDVMHHIPVAAFGDHENVSIEWTTGFLDSDVGIISARARTDEQEWLYHYRIDLQTGSPAGRFETPFDEDDIFMFLGDGTWVMSQSNGDLARFHG